MELLIIDDGSTDGTPTFVTRYLEAVNPRFTFTILQCNHRGPGAARNVGIRAAKGSWIAFLDSDDLWLAGKLEAIFKIIRKEPTANFVCHNEYYSRLDGTIVQLDYSQYYNPKMPLPPQLYSHNCFSTSAVACLRTVFNQHGFFDESLMSAQDYELWLRLSPHLNIAFSHERLGIYVQRHDNITSGSALRRMRNELIISQRHRQHASYCTYAKRMMYIILYYAKSLLVSR
jgi:glycosyltransferase involved in cell wall biosynthesis